MSKSRFTETQIVSILQETDAGRVLPRYQGVLEILCQFFNLYGKRVEQWQRRLILKQH